MDLPAFGFATSHNPDNINLTAEAAPQEVNSGMLLLFHVL